MQVSLAHSVSQALHELLAEEPPPTVTGAACAGLANGAEGSYTGVVTGWLGLKPAAVEPPEATCKVKHCLLLAAPQAATGSRSRVALSTASGYGRLGCLADDVWTKRSSKGRGLVEVTWCGLPLRATPSTMAVPTTLQTTRTDAMMSAFLLTGRPHRVTAASAGSQMFMCT